MMPNVNEHLLLHHSGIKVMNILCYRALYTKKLNSCMRFGGVLYFYCNKFQA